MMSFFRFQLSYKVVARQFLKQHLPLDLQKQINWKTLNSEPTSLIITSDLFKKFFKEKVSDVIYSVRLNNNKEAKLCVICEHQSTPDEWMILRAAQYTLNAAYKYIRQGKALPLIYVIVIYNGSRKYHYPTDWKELVDADPELVDRYFLRGYQLLNLKTLPPKLSEDFLLSDMLKFVLYAHTHKMSADEEEEFLKQLGRYLSRVKEDELKTSYLFYLVKIKNYDPEKLLKCLGQENEEIVMTLAKRWENDGWKKGWNEGRSKGWDEGRDKGIVEGEQRGELNAARAIAKQLLQDGMPLQKVARVTGLMLGGVEQLQQELTEV